MRISDWSSDVCSSVPPTGRTTCAAPGADSHVSAGGGARRPMSSDPATTAHDPPLAPGRRQRLAARAHAWRLLPALQTVRGLFRRDLRVLAYHRVRGLDPSFAFDPQLVSASPADFRSRSAEHTSELQSLT